MPKAKTAEPTLLEKLIEQRTARVDDWSTVVTEFEDERGTFEARALETEEAKRPTDEERDAFTSAKAAFIADCDQRQAEIREFDRRIDDQKEMVRRRQETIDASKPVVDLQVRSEPLTYRRDNGRGMEGISYFRDLANVLIGDANFASTTKAQSTERLLRHADEMSVEIPKRIEAAEQRAQEKVALAETRGKRSSLDFDPFHRGAVYNPVEKRVEPNRTDGFGGYFIPPLWLPEEYIPGLRAHLVAAGLCRQLDLPQGTDSINIPKLANLTAVGYQQADNSGVVTQDWTDTFVQANVKTASGQSDVALQLLEQSPNGITDEVIMTDLMAAYNQFVDAEVIHGDGLNTGQLAQGHIQGLYNGAGGSAWANANSVTWTAASPKPYSFVQVMGAMASQIAKTRFDVEQLKFVVHGRRAMWYLTGLDANDRPLGETPSGGRYNIAAAINGGLQAEGLVATLPSIGDTPLYIDDNIGTADTTGGVSAGDYALAFLADDAWLFLGDLRTNVFREVLSGSLGIRFQLYNYFAFLLRYGQSLCTATGTGFAAPAGQIDSSILY